MSGVRNVHITRDIPDVFDTDVLFIIDWDKYSKFKNDLIAYPKIPKIIYKHLTFKSVFPNRLCKYISHITSNDNIFIFSYRR